MKFNIKTHVVLSKEFAVEAKSLKDALSEVEQLLATVDGRLGPKTLAAININDPRQLHLRVTFERLKFLESIARKPEQKGFLEGWKNRVAYLTYE